MNRALPQNIEAERGLLGIILDDNGKLFDVSGIVGKADFIEPMHGELYTLLRDMIETGREAKPSTVMHDLSQDADIGGVSASAYLAQLERDAPSAGMAKTFARTVRDLSMRRRGIAIAEKHLDEFYSAPATISALEIENRYHAAASAMFSTVQEAGMQPLPDVGMELLKDTQKALQGDRAMGLLTGLKGLDDLWGPLLPGRLHSVAGASGSGKTALAWQIARHVGESAPVLFMSLEMARSELATRDLTFLTSIPGERIESASLNEEEFVQLVEAQRLQRTSGVVIDDAKGQTVGAIRGKALRMKKLKGLGLLVIDHWRYLSHGAAGNKNDIETNLMHDDLRAINAIGDDLGIPVILLAQLKASYASEPKVREPNVGDIYNGAVLEQESDALLIVHRLEYLLARRKPSDGKDVPQWALDMNKARHKAQLLLNKRRGGQGYGVRTVGWDGPTQRFSDEVRKVDPMEEVLIP